MNTGIFTDVYLNVHMNICWILTEDPFNKPIVSGITGNAPVA